MPNLVYIWIGLTICERCVYQKLRMEWAYRNQHKHLENGVDWSWFVMMSKDGWGHKEKHMKLVEMGQIERVRN